MQNNNRNGLNAEYTYIRRQAISPNNPQYTQNGSVGKNSGRQSARPDMRTSYQNQSNYSRNAAQRGVKPLSVPRSSGQRRAKQSSARRRSNRHGFIHDFLLGFGIGLAIFGTAAFFVVRALIELII